MLAGFSSYWWLLLLLFLLLWGGIRFVREKNSQQKQPLFFNNQNFSPFREHALLQVLLLLFGLLLLLVALWRPQWGEEIQKTEKKGLDIVFAVDVSKSMNALDFSRGNQLISRLDAVRYLVEEFTKTRPSDRLGLVEFAGESFVASPLTLDHTVFLNFLQGISDDDLGIQGTNLSEAIEVSLARLEVQAPDERGKAIVLFSDGEETLSSDAEKMAEVAKKKRHSHFYCWCGFREWHADSRKSGCFWKYHLQALARRVGSEQTES
jgi:Ca-activated chloride channel family protein